MLYVWDSLFIQYNATQANAANNSCGDDGGEVVRQRKVGAGQLLHCNLGYVSVIVILNSWDKFEGGGTLFKNQLQPMLARGNNRLNNDA